MPHKKHGGVGLIIGGAIIAMLFLAFIYVVPHSSPSDATPLWIGAIWAMLAMCWGLFRFVAGPSKLDHLHGGTDADL
ncbi:hypothetical protein [Glutamicibacter sp.]|uniref:hypothetical protein n=1 Tax=Glutamicibacter sp. TaxID=1931995 RepID=UPI0028BD3C1F|nr:hypothetical protein [Glutamicibacter sp.]